MQGDFEPLHEDDPPLIDSYRLVSRIEESSRGVMYLARSVGGRDVTVMLMNGPIPDEATGVRMFGSQAYLVNDYAGPSLPARTEKRSRDILTWTLLSICIVVFVLSAIVIGYLWYYNIDLQPLRGF